MLHQLIEEIKVDQAAGVDAPQYLMNQTPDDIDPVLPRRTYINNEHLALDSIPETSALNFKTAVQPERPLSVGEQYAIAEDVIDASRLGNMLDRNSAALPVQLQATSISNRKGEPVINDSSEDDEDDSQSSLSKFDILRTRLTVGYGNALATRQRVEV